MPDYPSAWILKPANRLYRNGILPYGKSAISLKPNTFHMKPWTFKNSWTLKKNSRISVTFPHRLLVTAPSRPLITSPIISSSLSTSLTTHKHKTHRRCTAILAQARYQDSLHAVPTPLTLSQGQTPCAGPGRNNSLARQAHFSQIKPSDLKPFFFLAL